MYQLIELYESYITHPWTAIIAWTLYALFILYTIFSPNVSQSRNFLWRAFWGAVVVPMLGILLLCAGLAIALVSLVFLTPFLTLLYV